MKTKEELNALKKEVEAVNEKFAELTEEEIKQVTGGTEPSDGVKPMPTAVWMGIPRSEG